MAWESGALAWTTRSSSGKAAQLDVAQAAMGSPRRIAQSLERNHVQSRRILCRNDTILSESHEQLLAAGVIWFDIPRRHSRGYGRAGRIRFGPPEEAPASRLACESACKYLFRVRVSDAGRLTWSALVLSI